jgi:hypothetical protein
MISAFNPFLSASVSAVNDSALPWNDASRGPQAGIGIDDVGSCPTDSSQLHEDVGKMMKQEA